MSASVWVMGARAAVVGLVTGIAGCGTILSIDSDPAGPTDGGGGNAVGSVDGGGDSSDATTEGSTPCAIECSPGACVGGVCQPFVHVSGAGARLDGVAATEDRVFFTSYAGSFIRVSVDGGAPTDVLPTEGRAHAIEVTANDQIQWGKDFKLDGVSGIFKAAFDGTARLPAIAANESSVFAFAFGPAVNEHYWSIQTDGAIRHSMGGSPQNDFAPSGGRTILYMARASDLLLWTDGDRVRKAPLSGGAATAIVTTLSPVGLAVHGGWVFFTNGGTGTVHRVPLAGGVPETLALRAGSPPSSVGGIAVTPSGKLAFWADENRILGLRLPK